MKTTIKFGAILILAYLLSCTLFKNSPLVGSWKLISAEYILPDTTIVYQKIDLNRIKIFNKTHFATVGQSKTSENYIFNAGTYIVNKNTLSENMEFFSDKELLGSTLSYKFDIKGNQLSISGPIKKIETEKPNWKLHEVWEKLQ